MDKNIHLEFTHEQAERLLGYVRRWRKKWERAAKRAQSQSDLNSIQPQLDANPAQIDDARVTEARELEEIIDRVLRESY